MERSEVNSWSTARQAEYHRSELEKVIRAAAKEAEADYRREHPQTGALRTKSEIIVYRKPPRGFYNHAPDMVELFLASKLARYQTNAEFVARLNERFSPYIVPANILTRTLTQGPLKKIEAALSRNGVWIDLRKHNTLSKIKLALRAKLEDPSGARSYALSIEFHLDAVVVGNTRFPVTRHQAGYTRLRVGNQWLRSDVLEEFVRKGTS